MIFWTLFPFVLRRPKLRGELNERVKKVAQAAHCHRLSVGCDRPADVARSANELERITGTSIMREDLTRGVKQAADAARRNLSPLEAASIHSFQQEPATQVF